MRHRREVNFMGNSYMDWKEKGKGFLWGGEGAGSRWKGTRVRWRQGCKKWGRGGFIPPAAFHLPPDFVFRERCFWLTISNSFGP